MKRKLQSRLPPSSCSTRWRCSLFPFIGIRVRMSADPVRAVVGAGDSRHKFSGRRRGQVRSAGSGRGHNGKAGPRAVDRSALVGNCRWSRRARRAFTGPGSFFSSAWLLSSTLIFMRCSPFITLCGSSGCLASQSRFFLSGRDCRWQRCARWGRGLSCKACCFGSRWPQDRWL